MSRLGEVRIGHKAPDFHCEAVIGGAIREVSLSTFVRPSTSPGTPGPDAPWLLLLFIPAAFSFVCPTEVIAFQTCYDEFRDRNCSVAFVSVDTKHSLWHWQNVPRQYGGLGNIDIPLLSDATHKIGRDYGVLIEEEGVSLRGMFIIDGEGLVQQITLNNLTVGRSVLEALRLLEAFQAVAKHGVLCPVDWKPSAHASDTMNTISNTLVESYEVRLANLQKEFGDVQVTDLDAKHKSTGSIENVPHAEFVNTPGVDTVSTPSSFDRVLKNFEARDPPLSPGHSDCTPRVCPTPLQKKSTSLSSKEIEKPQPDSPITAVNTPVTTPSIQDPAPPEPFIQERTARRSRGYTTTHLAQDAPGAPTRPTNPTRRPHTYESQQGSHVILEFADPTASPMVSPNLERKAPLSHPLRHHVTGPARLSENVRRAQAPMLSRSTSWNGVLKRENSSGGTPVLTPTMNAERANGSAQTRLQATFQEIKNTGAGLVSPRLDCSLGRKAEGGKGGWGTLMSMPSREVDGVREG